MEEKDTRAAPPRSLTETELDSIFARHDEQACATACKEFRLASALREARRLLRGIRGMIAEDTTFPGAVIRVEIDAFLGEQNGQD